MQQVSLNGQWIKPSKVVCIGRNYVEHINELGNDELAGIGIGLDLTKRTIQSQLKTKGDGRYNKGM